MRIKLLALGFIILTSSCASGPTACECLDSYHYKGVDVHNFSEGVSRLADPRKCIEKYGSEIPESYRGTPEFKDKMIEVLEKQCDEN